MTGGRARVRVAAEGVRLIGLEPASPEDGTATGGDSWNATLALERRQALRLIEAENFAREIRLIPAGSVGPLRRDLRFEGAPRLRRRGPRRRPARARSPPRGGAAPPRPRFARRRRPGSRRRRCRRRRGRASGPRAGRRPRGWRRSPLGWSRPRSARPAASSRRGSPTGTASRRLPSRRPRRARSARPHRSRPGRPARRRGRSPRRRRRRGEARCWRRWRSRRPRAVVMSASSTSISRHRPHRRSTACARRASRRELQPTTSRPSAAELRAKLIEQRRALAVAAAEGVPELPDAVRDLVDEEAAVLSEAAPRRARRAGPARHGRARPARGAAPRPRRRGGARQRPRRRLGRAAAGGSSAPTSRSPARASSAT